MPDKVGLDKGGYALAMRAGRTSPELTFAYPCAVSLVTIDNTTATAEVVVALVALPHRGPITPPV